MASSGDIYGKPAKMWVREICVKRKFTSPEYQTDKIGDNPPKFRSTCTIPDSGLEKGEGIGATKKDAEQRAAQIMLSHLDVPLKELYELSAEGKAARLEKLEVEKAAAKPKNKLELESDSLKDTDDNLTITGDPVGLLFTISARNKLDSPVYQEKHDTTSDNKNLFTITCMVGTITSQVGKCVNNKKQAKKVAAFKAIQDLEKKGYPVVVSSKKKSVSTASSSSKSVPEVSSSSATSVSVTPEEATAEDISDSCISPTMNISLVMEPEKDKPESEAKECAVSISAPTTSEAENGTMEDSSEDEEEQMLIDSTIKSLKRKLDIEACIADVKRQCVLPSGTKLTCTNKSEKCIKFVRDYAHIFQHLPESPSLDESLAPSEFLKTLQNYGGPLGLLLKFQKELGLKLKTFPPIPLVTGDHVGKLCVFLEIEFPFECKFAFQKKSALNGIGATDVEAKENAALEALKMLRLMLFTDNP